MSPSDTATSVPATVCFTISNSAERSGRERGGCGYSNSGSCKKEGPVSQRFTEQGRVPSSAGLSELGTKRHWEEVLLSSICAKRLDTKTGKRFAEFRIMYNTVIE